LLLICLLLVVFYSVYMFHLQGIFMLLVVHVDIARHSLFSPAICHDLIFLLNLLGHMLTVISSREHQTLQGHGKSAISD